MSRKTAGPSSELAIVSAAAATPELTPPGPAARIERPTRTATANGSSWGAQDVLPYGSFKPRLIPRRLVKMTAGPPVDLSEFEGKPIDNQTMRGATDKIMADVTQLVAGLRGETPPARPYHPAVARREERRQNRLATGESPASPDHGAPGS